jgi:4-amino-4-deoxy-L-arabinose transferase-like glycosyltransferase
LLAIALTALAMRLAYLWSIHDAPFFQQLQTEPLHYHRWATRILDGPVPLPPFEQSPGYPYVVALVYALLGRSVTAVACVQAILDAATCVLLAVTARRWFGARAGLIAGVLAALYGPFIYFTGQLLPPTLFVFLAVAAASAGAAARPVVAGCLWAAALSVRSEIVVAVPFVLFDAWRRGALWATAAPIAVCAAALFAFNVAGGAPVPFTTGGGVNLWLGNNPHADGVNPFIFGPLEAVADDVRAHAATSAEADRIFRRHALSFIHDQPGAALRLARKKLVWTLTDRELPNTDDVEWVTSHSWIFWRPMFPLSFGMLLPFALAGATLVGRQWRELTPLAGLVATGVVTGVVFFTNGRFRLIMVPAVLLLAALALDRLPRVFDHRPRQWRPLLQCAAGVLAGVVLAWGNFYGVRAYRIPQISVNIGILLRQTGQVEAAVRHLRAGLAAQPRDAVGWLHLAFALEQLGRIDDARQAYRDGLSHIPGDPRLAQMAARFTQRHGDAP